MVKGFWRNHDLLVCLVPCQCWLFSITMMTNDRKPDVNAMWLCGFVVDGWCLVLVQHIIWGLSSKASKVSKFFFVQGRNSSSCFWLCDGGRWLIKWLQNDWSSNPCVIICTESAWQIPSWIWFSISVRVLLDLSCVTTLSYTFIARNILN